MKLRGFLHCSFDELSHRFSFPRPWLRLRSATEVENYFIVCCFVLFFETQRLFIIPMFLRKQSWRNSFAMKLCGNCIFSITKFSEMWWNDGAFEDSEKHWKLWRREVEIFAFIKRFFNMLSFIQNDWILLFYTHGLKIWNDLLFIITKFISIRISEWIIYYI